MDYGTACGRLRKILLFEFARKLGMDSCFKCNTSIEDVEQFTIEHKTPWMDNDPDLFWDLNNIAFSHAKCNLPHKFHGRPSPRRGEDGTWLCLDCGLFLPEDEFSLYTAGTPRNWCKSCRATRKAEGKSV